MLTYPPTPIAAKLAANIAAMGFVPQRSGYAAKPTRAPRTQSATRPFIEAKNRRVSCCLPKMRRAPAARVLPRTLPACPAAVFPLPEDRPRARRRPWPCVFPLQFSPFGNPLARIPLFKGGLHQRGQTAGGTRTAAFLENGAKPRNRRGFLQRRFRPPPYGWPPPPPPLHQPRCARPQSWGQRVGRAETGCGRSGPRTVSALRGRRKAATGSPPKSCAAGFASRPATRRACSPSACGDLHRRVEAQSCSSPPGAPTVRLPPHNPPPARALMEK